MRLVASDCSSCPAGGFPAKVENHCLHCGSPIYISSYGVFYSCQCLGGPEIVLASSADGGWNIVIKEYR